MIPDPAGQFHSLYLSMGNNLVAQINSDRAFVPLLIGISVGMIIGGIKASKVEGVSIGEEILKELYQVQGSAKNV